MLSIMRRIRTRLPTCLSVGFGVFFAIQDSPETSARGRRAE
jgi:hypothetical protein